MDGEDEDSDCDEEVENGDETLEGSQTTHDEAQLEAQAFDDAPWKMLVLRV